MSIRIIEDRSQVPWKLEVVPGEPPWIVEHPQPLPIDHPSYLCENCLRYNFGWLLFHDLNQAYAEIRKDNRRLIESYVVRIQQESTNAGLNKRSRAQEAKNDTEEYTKKVGATYTEVQSNAEMFDSVEKYWDKMYCGKGIGNGSSVQRGADGNAPSSHHFIYSHHSN